MELLSFNTKTILEKATYSKAYTEIPNNHVAVKDSLPLFQEVAELLGIKFEDTEYTLTVSKDKKVYTPNIKANDKGEPVLVWGKTTTPLTSLKGAGTIEGDKYSHMEWVVADANGDEVTLEFFLMLTKEAKESKLDKAAYRKAYRNGTLGQYLSTTFTKSKSISELVDGEYEVTNVRVGSYQNTVKFSVYVEGYGWFSANKGIANRILADYDEVTGKYIGTISKEYPACLDVLATDKKTKDGYAIVVAKLTTQEDLELPVFDFTEGTKVEESLAF